MVFLLNSLLPGLLNTHGVTTNMRSLRKKQIRNKKRLLPPKRQASLFGLMATLRRLGRVPKVLAVLVISCLGIGYLWWMEYPQQSCRYIAKTFIAMTGRVGFSLQDVLVEGRHNTSLDKILKVVDARRGDALLAHDPYIIKKNLEQISWIRQATVKRQFPGIILIQLEERLPVALWQHRQKHYLVDEKGVIISSDNLQAFTGLPVIVGEDAPVHAPQVLALLEKFPFIRQKVTALVRVGNRRWDLHLNKTLQVKLPEMDLETALKKLSFLFEQKKINQEELAIIDLRIPGQTVMRLSPSAAIRLKGKGKET
jgi:cell division protein FtsQ